jgi:hypothetical protein
MVEDMIYWRSIRSVAEIQIVFSDSTHFVGA